MRVRVRNRVRVRVHSAHSAHTPYHPVEKVKRTVHSRLYFNQKAPETLPPLRHPQQPPYHTSAPHTCTVYRHNPCPGCCAIARPSIPLSSPTLPGLHHTPYPHIPSPHTCTVRCSTTMASQWRLIAASHAHAHSARCTRRCQSESCAPLVRCARSRRARGGACRVVAVIVRGRQPSAGRRAGRLSPAARAPRRGCSAPCAP